MPNGVEKEQNASKYFRPSISMSVANHSFRTAKTHPVILEADEEMQQLNGWLYEKRRKEITTAEILLQRSSKPERLEKL
jgi:hypothetical protein